MAGIMLVGPLALMLIAHHPPPPSVGGCRGARLTHGWCGPCKVGFVASVEIRSPVLYEALDPHGHDLVPDAIECTSCKAGLAVDGYCEVHRYGFVGGHAYMTKLTYYLAKGQALDVSRIDCRTCRMNAERHRHQPGKTPLETGGWCDTCQVGMVGNVALRDRKDFEAASREFSKLLEAVQTARRCELCAGAMLYDTHCPVCNISYKDGKPLKPPRTGGNGKTADGPADRAPVTEEPTSVPRNE